MVGHIGLLHNAKNLTEPVDQKVITVVALYEAQNFLADSFQSLVLLLLQICLIAFGGVIDDASRLRSQTGLERLGFVLQKHGVGYAWLV